MHSIISATSFTSHLRVFLLVSVGVAISSLVHMEFRGASMRSVIHVDNVDTSHLIALKGTHNPQNQKPATSELAVGDMGTSQRVVLVEPYPPMGERVQRDPCSESFSFIFHVGF